MSDQFKLFETEQQQPLPEVSPKAKYNRTHYEKNKAKILTQAKTRYRSKKESNQKVIPLFGGIKSDSGGTEVRLPPPPPSAKKPTRSRFKFNWSTVFLQILVLAISYFLVTETAAFFAMSDQTTAGPILKALLLDGSVLALSLMKPRSVISGLIQKVMVGLIYAYTVWVVSGGLWYAASQQRVDFALNDKSAIELETEIAKMILLRDQYFQANRIKLGTRMDQSVSQLRSKLEEVRAKVLKTPNTEIIWNSLLTLVVFRILVMISNLFCLAELKRRYSGIAKNY